MSDELSASKERLRKQDPDFRKLETEHHRLELELNGLIRRKTLTPQEESHKKQIQVEKLHAKDRMEAMIREFINRPTAPR
jgi:uncharacterized protein YdcH (DUF465 family)